MNFKPKNTKLINKNGYAISLIIYLISIIGLVLFFNYCFEIDKSSASKFSENSVQLSIQIIIRNSINFFQYIIFAPLMPLFYMLDCILTSWAIAISINTYGLWATLCKLFPHGLVEVPNFALYTYISYNIMKNFYANFKNKNHSLIKDILSYKKILLISLFLVIFAGIIEGIIT